MKEHIKLSQFLDYMDCGERIQIVFSEDTWEQYDEFRANSPLLKQFADSEITGIGIISTNVVRIEIEKGE